MATKNKQYWARRMKRLNDAILDGAYKDAQHMERAYTRAIREIDTKINAWYQRLADNNGVSFAEAQKLLTKDELAEFHWTVQEYIDRGSGVISGDWAKQLENASARVHITRLDALKLQLQQHAEELTGQQIATTTKAATAAYTESYYHTAFELQQLAGVGVTMQKVDTRRLEKVLSRPWTADNTTFTARCWTDKNKLVDLVDKELTRMVATGAKPDVAIKNIAHAFETSRSNAGRVVMTESAFFASAAQKDCYNELDVERFEVVGTFDARMCDYCAEMNGQVFPMKDFKAGTTAPPFHPWCRCTTAPYFEDMQDIGERWARDSETGKGYFVPSDMTYEEWKATQDAKYGEGAVDIARKKAYNEKADREQYERYKEALGKEAPKNFKDFQNLKYDNPERYAQLKVRYADAGIQQRIRSGNVNLTIHEGRQGKHIRGHNNYISGRSYLNPDVDAQALVNKYAGSGEILRDAKGHWNHKEVITADRIIGADVSLNDRSETPTSMFTIHYSNKGTHIVPRKE